MAEDAAPARETPGYKAAVNCTKRATRGWSLKPCSKLGVDWWLVRTFRRASDVKRKWDDYWFTTYEGKGVRCRTLNEVQVLRRKLEERPAKKARDQDEGNEADGSESDDEGSGGKFDDQQGPGNQQYTADDDESDFELSDDDRDVTESDHGTDSLADVDTEDLDTEAEDVADGADQAKDTAAEDVPGGADEVEDGDYHRQAAEDGDDGDDDIGDFFDAGLPEGEVEELSGAEAAKARAAESADDEASSEGDSDPEEAWADPMSAGKDLEDDVNENWVSSEDEPGSSNNKPDDNRNDADNAAENNTKPPKPQYTEQSFLRRTVEEEPPQPEIIVNEKTRKILQSAQSKEISYNNVRTSLKRLCHFPLCDEEGGTDLLKCVVTPGSTVYHATEQSNKTAGIVGLSIICSVLKVPHIVIMADKVDNVKANTEGKINVLLKQFCRNNGRVICADFRSGEAVNWEGNNEAFIAQGVRNGQITLVVPPTTSALQKLVGYLREYEIKNVVLTLDEADALLSTRVMRAAVEGDTGAPLRTQREKFLYELLGCPPFQGAGRICRSVIWLSATNLATVWWHTCWDVPFRGVVANRHSLPGKGFSTEDDLKLARVLKRKDIVAKKGYGIDSLPVRREFRIFRKDTRKGLLMFLVTTPKVNAVGMNLFKMARYVLHKCVPKAVCIVIHGHSCYNMLYKDDEKPEASRGQGIQMRSTNGVSKAQHGIEYVDQQWGLKRPVVVLGYHCVGRAVSIRSNARVITHEIACYQQGKNAADTRQMLMRGAGYTREVRRKNKFRHVRMVCVKEDYLLVKRLHDFTVEVINNAGTGDRLGLKQWRDYHYPERYSKILELKRRHMQPGMQEDRPLVGRVPRSPLPGANPNKRKHSRQQAQSNLGSTKGVAVFHLRRPAAEELARPGSSQAAEEFVPEPLLQSLNGLSVTIAADCVLVGSHRAVLLTEAKYMSAHNPLLHLSEVATFAAAVQPGAAAVPADELKAMRKACQLALKSKLEGGGLLQGASERRSKGDRNCPLHHTHKQYRKVMVYFFTRESDAAHDGAGIVKQKYSLEELQAKPSGWYAWHALTDGKIEVRVKQYERPA